MTKFEDRLATELERAHRRHLGAVQAERRRPPWRPLRRLAGAVAIVAAVVLVAGVVIGPSPRERELSAPSAEASSPASLAAALGARLSPAPPGTRVLLPIGATPSGLDLDRVVRLPVPEGAGGHWLVIGGTDGVCVVLGQAVRCGSASAFRSGRLVAVSAAGRDYTTGPLAFSGVVPGRYARAVAVAPDGRRLSSVAIRGHAYRLVVAASAAASAQVRLVRGDGTSRIAFTPFLPPDIDTLVPTPPRTVSAAEVEAFSKRMPALVPESLRALSAPPRPAGVNVGGRSRSRTWYLGATQRYVCLWVGAGSICAPSAAARDEGLEMSTLPSDAPTNAHAAARYQGLRTDAATRVRAVARDGRTLASAPVVGRLYDLYVRDASDVDHLEFVRADGAVVLAPG